VEDTEDPYLQKVNDEGEPEIFPTERQDSQMTKESIK
jgi:hypothetical protein